MPIPTNKSNNFGGQVAPFSDQSHWEAQTFYDMEGQCARGVLVNAPHGRELIIVHEKNDDDTPAVPHTHSLRSSNGSVRSAAVVRNQKGQFQFRTEDVENDARHKRAH